MTATRRKARRMVTAADLEPARDLAGAAAYRAPDLARADQAPNRDAVRFRVGIGRVLGRTWSLDPHDCPPGTVPPVGGTTVRVPADECPEVQAAGAVPPMILVPFSGVGWIACHVANEWSPTDLSDRPAAYLFAMSCHSPRLA